MVQLDTARLRARYRIWHVEALLNQAADLCERAVQEVREYDSLEFTRAQMEISSDEESRLIALEREFNPFERDLIASELDSEFLEASNVMFLDALREAKKLYGYRTDKEQGQAGWTRAGQNRAEKEVEEQSRIVRGKLADETKKWAIYDDADRKRRLDLRQRTLEKRVELMKEGGAFDLTMQREFVEKRMSVNYEAARERAYVAWQGLLKIYGYEVISPDVEYEDVREGIYNLLLWLRSAIEWLVAYRQLEQACTTVISLRASIADTEWDRLAASENAFSTEFVVSADRFLSDNVRMRSVSASLLGDVGEHPWIVRVRLPRAAIYVREETTVSIDQTDLPTCQLGRVEQRSVPRPVERCGFVSLVNGSPIGDDSEAGRWQIRLSRPPLETARFSDIQDVLIELVTVGIPGIGE